MRSARCLTLLALLSPALASAQLAEVYVTFSPTHVSGVQTGSVYTASGYQNQTTSFTTAGVGGGVTLNFLNLKVVKLGVDLRGSTRPGTSGADTALFGIKLTAAPPLLRLRPYLQASAGYLATRTPNVSTNSSGTGTVGGTFTNQYAVYEVLGGLDLRFLPFIDLRLIEVGGGSGFPAVSGNYNPVFYTINTGVVLHF